MRRRAWGALGAGLGACLSAAVLTGVAVWHLWRAADQVIRLARDRQWVRAVEVLERAGGAIRVTEDVLAPVAWAAGITPWQPAAQDVWHLAQGLGALDTAAAAISPAALRQWAGAGNAPGPLVGTLLRVMPGMARAADAVAAVDVSALSPALGREVRPWVERARRWAPRLNAAARDGRALAHALGLLGSTRLLVAYLDPGELRAGGGFVAAVGTARIRQGQLASLSVVPVSLWQATVRWHPRAPWLLRHAFGARAWQFMNLTVSPDIPRASQMALRMAASRPGQRRLAGVVWVNAALIEAVLRLTGPVSVAGVGTFTADGALMRMEQLANRYGLPVQAREGFLTPLLNAVYRHLLELPRRRRPQLAAVLMQGLASRQLMVDFRSPKAEALARALGWTGIPVAPPTANHLLVINQNLGAHKDNLFLRERLSVVIRRVGGRYQEWVTAHFLMPVVGNGGLTVGYTGWLQLLVPNGCRLIRPNAPDSSPIRITEGMLPHTLAFSRAFYVPTAQPHGGRPGRAAIAVGFWLPQNLDARRLWLSIEPGQTLPVTVWMDGRRVWQGPLTGDRLVGS